MDYSSIVFREFTHESLQRIECYRQEEAERITSERSEETLCKNNINDHHLINKSSKDPANASKRKPNKELATGETLPLILQYKFPPKLIGKPIEEIDQYYRVEYGFMVISANNTIYRFSSTRACYLFSPFNCFRRIAIRILTHSLFLTLVMITILTNCVFMTLKNAPEVNEYIFTAIYTVEALIKCVARGFILEKHTFLRDPWNWLDFIVIVLAYITFFVHLGNVAVLRTFRVLRALKTVAIVPGLKTIVNALIQSFIALRDVSVLSTFILSIFALVGLQLYMGTLRQKCVPSYDSFVNNTNSYSEGFNMSFESYLTKIDNEIYWYKENGDYLLCGNASGTVRCPAGYICWKDRGMNPNFGYTSFDNYGWAMLSCFRLMTQDYWENLYQLVLSTAGRYHAVFFVVVIFFGSFYLVNLILATVSMSYLKEQILVEAENKERERRRKDDELEIQKEEEGKVLEAHALLHVDNEQYVENRRSFEDSNHTNLHPDFPIELEQNGKKKKLSHKQSFQASPSPFQCDKLIAGATTIPFFRETQNNSTDEDRKSELVVSCSDLADLGQNDNRLTITLYQAEPHVQHVQTTEILSAQESNRTSFLPKSEYFCNVSYKICID
ncbi:unnamed protein product [Rotaria socialis]|uniref:Ion transport domain-containing protein n=1 Tax=Rotaria socialis TaxID=392032 RepID=A0A818GMZ8_9BILA|nr:unnamed protein product [Rotaria socialis]